jgi:hypothetical protein
VCVLVGSVLLLLLLLLLLVLNASMICTPS